MLIIVDLTIQNIAEMGKLKVSKFFERVADASESGKHCIYVPYNLVMNLLESNILSVSAEGPITRIGEESFQYGDLLVDDSFPKLRIKYARNEFKSGTGNNIIIGQENIINGDYLRETLLVVEDFRYDGEFYDFIFKEEANRTRFSDPNFDITNMGGKSKIGKTIEKFSNKKRIVVFVIDQDSVVKVSEKELKNRQRQLEKILNDGSCVGFIRFTPTHELENFLPITIVEKIGKKVDCDQLNQIKSLIQKQGKTAPGDCLWLFYDIKKGINGKKNEHGVIGIKNFEDFSTEEVKWLCEKYDIAELELEELQYPGFGDKVIPQFLKYHDYQVSFVKYMSCEKDNFNYWNYHFGDWMKSLLWLGCSDSVWSA